ncbi:hypothetical protein BD324DRAFT_649644 [Kockovaella imperatae]|uniref:Uncharacterized protein n=1 Tax=Kockovaella imperatae TaxID=4999 RepID=A0A1Y1UL37_9TREE|nr:hypothetical protein BD324DRAFT_649644 [Kockovaella imperatae]ORX38267.1 hypothetical protein BD324DRAFT_649644 [Kockovaella imperatae]
MSITSNSSDSSESGHLSPISGSTSWSSHPDLTDIDLIEVPSPTLDPEDGIHTVTGMDPIGRTSFTVWELNYDGTSEVATLSSDGVEARLVKRDRTDTVKVYRDELDTLTFADWGSTAQSPIDPLDAAILRSAVNEVGEWPPGVRFRVLHELSAADVETSQSPGSQTSTHGGSDAELRTDTTNVQDQPNSANGDSVSAS